MARGEMVLLVNDIPDHVAAYTVALTAHGMRVRVARSGTEALAALRAAAPRCTVIDLRIPDMDAWELCREVKRLPEARDMPVIVLTPDVSAACAAHSAHAGCDAWLAQPTVAEDLVRTLNQVLEMDTAAPRSLDEALIGIIACIACGSDQTKATLRLSPIQYYCCRACGFYWKAEAATASIR